MDHGRPQLGSWGGKLGSHRHCREDILSNGLYLLRSSRRIFQTCPQDGMVFTPRTIGPSSPFGEERCESITWDGPEGWRSECIHPSVFAHPQILCYSSTHACAFHPDYSKPATRVLFQTSNFGVLHFGGRASGSACYFGPSDTGSSPL